MIVIIIIRGISTEDVAMLTVHRQPSLSYAVTV